MPGRLNIKPKKSEQQLRQNCLTEENLRLHSYTFPQRSTSPQTNYFEEDRTWGETFEPYYQQDELEGSEDGDWDARRVDIALRRAASLEALKIYGGCFTSGFLAMQEPLPWMAPSNTGRKSCQQDVEGLDLRRLASEMIRTRGGSAGTSSRDSGSYIGSPRPDSDTLSRADIEKDSGRKWSWRSFGKRRLGTSKHACV